MTTSAEPGLQTRRRCGRQRCLRGRQCAVEPTLQRHLWRPRTCPHRALSAHRPRVLAGAENGDDHTGWQAESVPIEATPGEPEVQCGGSEREEWKLRRSCMRHSRWLSERGHLTLRPHCSPVAQRQMHQAAQCTHCRHQRRSRRRRARPGRRSMAHRGCSPCPIRRRAFGPPPWSTRRRCAASASHAGANTP